MSTRKQSFGQVLLVTVLAIGLGAAIALSTTDRVATSRGNATAATNKVVSQTSSSSSIPTCRSLGLDADARAEVTCTTRNARLTFVNGAAPIELGGVTARVRSVRAYTASTEAGRSRNRVRVVVAFEATAERAAAPEIYLAIGGERIKPDRAWRGAAAYDLATPLDIGARRRGQLRFEIGGEQTTRFRADGAQLALRAGKPDAGDLADVGIIRVRAPKTMRPVPDAE